MIQRDLFLLNSKLKKAEFLRNLHFSATKRSFIQICVKIQLDHYDFRSSNVLYNLKIRVAGKKSNFAYPRFQEAEFALYNAAHLLHIYAFFWKNTKIAKNLL